MIKIAYLFLKLLKIILPLGLVALVIFLVVTDLNIDGQRTILHSATDPSLMVQGPNPDNRVAGIESESKEKYWAIVIDPVYWQLILPRQYEKVEVEIVFQADGVPLVQLGGLISAQGWNFYWQGMQNDIFDKIDWPCLVDVDRNWYLCQRVKNYQSIGRFLLAPPVNRRVLNYNFPLGEQFYRIDIVGYNQDIDYQEFDYLIAKYQKPDLENSWLRQKFEFSIADLHQQDKVLQFALSAPGIDKRHQVVKVRELKFTLTKNPITWKNFTPKTIHAIKNYFTDKK